MRLNRKCVVQKKIQYTADNALPKRRQPSSALLPIASFSMMSRKSSILSGLISASTHTTNGLDLRADVDALDPIVSNNELGENAVERSGRDRARR